MNNRLESPVLIHQHCWQQLALAAQDLRHAWRTMALATVNASGTTPRAELRTVVLREVEAERRALIFFTDARSPKVVQIDAQPDAVLMVWCPTLSWQLRLRVQLEVETSGLVVSSRWARLKLTPAAQDYLSPLPPGTPLERYQPERGTREYFAVVTATVQAIDWLELHADGHRRAIFDATGQGHWVSP